ncbi:MAG: TOBE-like domain-containing protein, partial [Candidatus Limnocylindrales bacterium]
GFEVRIDLELAGGETAFAQLTREEARALELGAGDIVYVRHAGSTPPAARATGTGPGARTTGIQAPPSLSA